MSLFFFDNDGFVVPRKPGLQVWLDMADTSTITQVAGAVSQINDKSGNGNNATQGVGAAQPGTGGATQNGKNVLTFDGGDWMSIVNSASINLAGSCTFFLVGNLTNTTGTARTYLAKNVNDSYRLRVDQTTNFPWLLLNDGSGLTTYTGNLAVTIGSAVILTTVVDIGNNVKFFQNGADFGTSAISQASITQSSNPLIIGSIDGFSEFWLGSIGEILIYDRALSVSETTQINRYLSNKWGIAI